MEYLHDDKMPINQEFMPEEASSSAADMTSGKLKPSLGERILSGLGDALCRFGTKIKKYSRRKLASDEASTPTYLIML
jgi:hypothetical protein